MAAFTFFTYFILGIGPGVSFFVTVIAPKSFLVILSFFSVFYFLTALLIISAIFRGFYPLSASAGSYVGVVVASVLIEEAARVGVWFLHRKSVETLEAQARRTQHSFNILDKLYIALGWGYGHAASHSIFFFLSLLSLTVGNGTYYIETCYQMSLFLIGALYSLAFGLILTSCMVVAIEGYHTSNYLHIAYAPVVHLAAGLLTTLNFHDNGCLFSVPILMGLGAASASYAGWIAWQKGSRISRALLSS